MALCGGRRCSGSWSEVRVGGDEDGVRVGGDVRVGKGDGVRVGWWAFGCVAWNGQELLVVRVPVLRCVGYIGKLGKSVSLDDCLMRLVQSGQ